jgi:hypothetical protein
VIVFGVVACLFLRRKRPTEVDRRFSKSDYAPERTDHVSELPLRGRENDPMLHELPHAEYWSELAGHEPMELDSDLRPLYRPPIMELAAR